MGICSLLANDMERVADRPDLRYPRLSRPAWADWRHRPRHERLECPRTFEVKAFVHSRTNTSIPGRVPESRGDR